MVIFKTVISFGASWIKLPLWLDQNRLERGSHVFEPKGGLKSRALSRSENHRPR